MPTYEYACRNCGHTWEVEQRIVADPLTECPSCHQQTAQRQISGGNFILKGGGWYADLYSSSKPAAKSGDAKSDTKGDAKSGDAKSGDAKSGDTKSTSETKTEAKPAAKADTKPAPTTTPGPSEKK